MGTTTTAKDECDAVTLVGGQRRGTVDDPTDVILEPLSSELALQLGYVGGGVESFGVGYPRSSLCPRHSLDLSGRAECRFNPFRGAACPHTGPARQTT